MKAIIAIDSFKGSLSSLEAGNAIVEGIKKASNNIETEVCPLADGGEGTVEALTAGMGGRIETISVTNPFGKKITCQYGIAEKTAIIEIAAAAGITLIAADQRNPLYTTTYGVGEIIKDAIKKGCRHFIIGIGGSATNDGGIGMLQALGYGFLDKNQKQVCYGALGLSKLQFITTENVLPELKECTFSIACDVTNPLCGEQGCSAIFGPQKGATKKMIQDMDKWLQNYAALTKKSISKADSTFPGTGAAGGLGFAFLTFTNAVLESGIDIVLRETKLEDKIKTADIVITGEGQLDKQTVMGKAPIGVAKLAKKYSKLVIAFAGSVTEEANICNKNGIDAYFPILRRIVTLEEAMQKELARQNIIETSEQVFRLYLSK